MRTASYDFRPGMVETRCFITEFVLMTGDDQLAAGLFEDFPYQQESMILEKGSRLFIYTDGVSEAENSVKELYGDDRLLEFCGNEPTAETSEDFIAHLTASMKEFTRDNEQNDDITMMSILLK